MLTNSTYPYYVLLPSYSTISKLIKIKFLYNLASTHTFFKKQQINSYYPLSHITRKE